MPVDLGSLGEPEIFETHANGTYLEPFTVSASGAFTFLIHGYQALQLSATVEPCQFPDQPATAQALPCPTCELDILPPTSENPTTTRWKPQRADSTPIIVRFKGPIDLNRPSKATLEATPWGGAPVQVSNLDIAVEGTCVPPAQQCEYKVVWSGPWLIDGTRLPAGNYDIVVKATAGTAPSQRAVRSQTYDAVSLVEVKSVEILTSPGTETYPEISSNSGNGGGLNAYVDASAAGSDYRKNVTVRVTTEPPLRGELSDIFVHLKRLDVDDPYEPPPHVTGAGRNLVDDDSGGSWTDNRGDTALPAPIGLPIDANDQAELTVQVSTFQGDNYRFIASTHAPWLGSAAPTVPSSNGEVRHSDVPGHRGTDAGGEAAHADAHRVANASPRGGPVRPNRDDPTATTDPHPG
jgi:hypothetical protein